MEMVQKKKKERSDSSKKKKSIDKSLKPPTPLKKGIKNRNVASFN